MDFTEAFDLFKSNYNSHDYAMTERDFPVSCVYRDGCRHKVMDVYRTSNGTYFIVYQKKAVKERREMFFADNKECGYFSGEVNRMQR
ncbi:MAG: tetraspanin family protein [bacterium]